MRTTQIKKSQCGLTLIEVMVSLLILSVGMLGMLSLQMHLHQRVEDQQQRNTAIWRSQDLIDRIQINNSFDVALPEYVRRLNDPNLCAAAPPAICEETYNGAEVAAAVCDAQQMAHFDSWQAVCSNNGAEQLRNLRINFNCAGGVCTANSLVTLQFIWAAKSASIAADPRLIGTSSSMNTANPIGPSDDYYQTVFQP